LLLLEGAANNHQWRRVFGLASLIISLSSQPAEASSPQQGGRTFAPPEQPMSSTRDGASMELAVGRLFMVFLLCRDQTVNKSLYSSLA